MQIKTGDTVVVIAGKDRLTKDAKGNIVPTTGKVLKVYPKTNRVIVEGVNKVTKHQKPTQANPDGGIIQVEAPIHASFFCTSSCIFFSIFAKSSSRIETP